MPSSDSSHVLRIANELGKVLGVAGAVTAGLAFERGEYMSRAWLLFGLCYVLLLVADVVGLSAPSTASVLASGACVVVANGLSVASTWMLARAWNVAGFEDDEPELRRKWALRAGATAIVVAITAWPLVSDLRELRGGDLKAVVSVASDLGDLVTLALIAPVLQTALAMRGGLLRWPWGLLAAGSLAWLVYDVTSDAAGLMHLDHGPFLIASESIRLLAGGWIFAAGLAQRMVLVEE